MQTVEHLEERLSEPTAAVVEVLRELEGDLILLGVAGKIGPSLARMARRASDLAGVRRRVIGVARFSQAGERAKLERYGIETVQCDLLDEEALDGLPAVPNVLYLAGMKFGAVGQEARTWAVNTYLPARACRKFRDSRLVAYSTGNIYGAVPVAEGGSREGDPPNPTGEYAMSCLGRERMIEHFSRALGFPATILRLNYACELRYGVLVDIAQKVWNGHPIDLTMGSFNVIWQRDANAVTLEAFTQVATPPRILNLTGPELLRVREVANEFGRRFGHEVHFRGVEAPTALVSNATVTRQLFGAPSVHAMQLIDWIAEWIHVGGPSLGKPTHFEVRDGKY